VAGRYHPAVDIDSVVASAEELAARPFPDTSAPTGVWLEGMAQSGESVRNARGLRVSLVLTVAAWLIE
jgi:hypothetical protein